MNPTILLRRAQLHYPDFHWFLACVDFDGEKSGLSIFARTPDGKNETSESAIIEMPTQYLQEFDQAPKILEIADQKFRRMVSYLNSTHPQQMNLFSDEAH